MGSDKEVDVDPPKRSSKDDDRVADKDRSKGDRDASKSGKKDRKEKRRSVSRSRSRDRDRRRRSRSRDRRSSRRSRSRSRDYRRSRSRDRRRTHGGESRRRDRSRSRSEGEDFGYKPRKRLPDAPPQVAIGPGTGPDPYAALRQQQPVAAVDPAEITRLWHEQQLKARQLVLQQQAASAAQAASKTQREIYVGNLMAGAITDSTLVQVFNTALMVRFPGSNIPGMEPVIRVNMHSSGKYAFIEFRTPEMASASLDLNGQVQFMGQAMSVNRPSGYVDPGKAAVAAQAATHALTAFQQGGYTGLQAGASALTGPMAAVGAIQSAAVAQSVAAAMAPGIAGAALPVPPALAAAVTAAAGPPTLVPTTFLCVQGMVTAAVLADDSEYKEVIEDLSEECGRQTPGSVLQVKVPRPPAHLAASLFETGDYGKAYVKFANITSANAARTAIHGRMFSGSMVTATFVTEAAFNAVSA